MTSYVSRTFLLVTATGDTTGYDSGGSGDATSTIVPRLNDNDATTGAYFGTSGGVLEVQMASPPIPENERIYSVRPRAHARQSNDGVVFGSTLLFRFRVGGGSFHANQVSTVAAFSFTDIAPTPALLNPSGAEWTITDLLSLRANFNIAAGVSLTADVAIAEAYLDVITKTRPVVEILEPVGLTANTQPSVLFNFIDVDGEPQSQVEYEVFNSVNVLVASGTFIQDTQTFQLPQMPPDQYRLRVRAAKVFQPTTQLWFSEWDEVEFEISRTGQVDVRAPDVLGCGTYQVVLQAQGGRKLAVLPWSSLQWNRLLEDVSDSTIEIPTSSIARAKCQPVLDSIRPWKHEIGIYRDGAEAWVGPITSMKNRAGGVTIASRDLFSWMERRRLPIDRTLENEDVTTIFTSLFNDAYDQDTTPNIVVTFTFAGITATRVVKAWDSIRAADELRELGRSGVDWTMYGRVLVVGGNTLPIPNLPTLITDDFIFAEEDRDGIDMATEVTVIGAGGGPDSAPVYARAGGVDVEFGLVQQTATESTILDTTSAQANADSRLALLAGEVSIVQGDLSPKAHVNLQRLIPGALCELRLGNTALPIIGQYRLSRVSVSATASEAGNTETVNVEFEPVGIEE